jgi:adenylate cyclase
MTASDSTTRRDRPGDGHPDSPEAFEEAVFASLFVEQRAQRTVSAAAIEAAGGMTVDELGDLWRAFGLPAPDPSTPHFSPVEADALTRLDALEDLWPPDVRLKVGRIYGHALSQVAATEVEVFRAHVERSIRATSPDQRTAIGDIAHAYGRLAPLIAPIMLGVHQRWLESVMAQVAVGEASGADASARLVGTVDVTLLFCDLIRFTSFTARHGDLAAAQVAADLASIVHEHQGADGYLVKELGDGALVAYSDPAAAVRAWSEIVAAARDRSLAPLHGAVHRGEAVFRGGDYFGAAVNLTARLVGLAPRGELFATESVVQATSEQFHWRARRRRHLAGIPGTIPLFSLGRQEGGGA